MQEGQVYAPVLYGIIVLSCTLLCHELLYYRGQVLGGKQTAREYCCPLSELLSETVPELRSSLVSTSDRAERTSPVRRPP